MLVRVLFLALGIASWERALVKSVQLNRSMQFCEGRLHLSSDSNRMSPDLPLPSRGLSSPAH